MTTATEGAQTDCTAAGRRRQGCPHIPVERAVAFTGHRPKRLAGYDESHPTNVWVKDRLRRFVAKAVEHGYKHFVCGGALGVDTWAAEAVLQVRRTDPEVELVIAVPCMDQDRLWPEEARTRYRKILGLADKVVHVSEEPYRPELMRARDRWMVEHCSVLIAVWTGQKGGGTHHCLNYAAGLGRRVLWVNPEAKTVGWLPSL